MRSKLQRPRVGVCPVAVCVATVLAVAAILWLPLGARQFAGKAWRSATPPGKTGLAAAEKSKRVEPAGRPRAVESYSKLPLSFEANQGQTDRRVKFLSRGGGYSLFLTWNEAVLALRKPSRQSKVEG